MAFNIIAETAESLDYTLLHKEIYVDGLPFEFIPMKGLGKNTGDAIGICVPLNNSNQTTWKKLEPILLKLKMQFHCEVYDLYGGQRVESSNFNSIKENLLGE